MSDPVRVVYRKYDGTLHWNQVAWRLGEDEHGVWVGAPAGTPIRLGEQVREPAVAAHVFLFAPGAWWTATFNAPPHRTLIYCDITTVPAWSGNGNGHGEISEVSMVDLDLDVRRRRGGAVELLDEDEFALHRVHFGYPPEVAAAAQAAADWLVGALGERVEPFDTGFQHWLELAERLGEED
jgi:protein associated with RNAse G/E